MADNVTPNDAAASPFHVPHIAPSKAALFARYHTSVPYSGHGLPAAHAWSRHGGSGSGSGSG
eukprot:1420224-Rhodomonas_salina.1